MEIDDETVRRMVEMYYTSHNMSKLSSVFNFPFVTVRSLLERYSVDSSTEARKVKFWCSIDCRSEDVCWEWKLRIVPVQPSGRGGYGMVTFNKHFWYTHRLAYALTYGPIPEGLLVLHRCDNRKCCNPKHLFLGSAKDNTQDAIVKDRFAHGSRQGRATVTDTQAVEIRERVARGEAQLKIAKELGIHSSVVFRIVHGQAWKNCRGPVIPSKGAYGVVKYSRDQVEEVKRLRLEGRSYPTISAMTGISISQTWRIAMGMSRMGVI